MAVGTSGTAVITGASAGIGEGFARALASQGYDLVLVARRKERLDELATELAGQHDVTVDVIEADLAAEDGVAAVEERVRADDVEILVNNAGFGTVGNYAKLPLERELQEVDLNVRALMRLTHAALGPMSERRRGGIINVASTAAFQPIPHNATYSATKAFVLHFTEAIHEEAKESNVSVTCLCPGPVQTEFQKVAGIERSNLPSVAWTSVESVVDAALAALKGGRAITVPGPMNKAGAMSSRMMPRFVVRRIAGAMFRNAGS